MIYHGMDVDLYRKWTKSLIAFVTLIPWSVPIYDTDLALVGINDLDARRESHSEYAAPEIRTTFYLQPEMIFLFTKKH